MKAAQFSANAPASLQPVVTTGSAEALSRRSVGFAVAPAQAQGQGPGGQATAERERFEQTKLSSEQRDIRSLGDARQNAINEADALTKVAGNRAFRADKDGIWVESKKEKAARVVTVKAYSEAYFAILKELPELAQLLTVGDKVRLEGRVVAIEITPEDRGLRTVDPTTLAALVRDWR